MNFSLKIDLLKIKGATLRNVVGKSGKNIKCLIIPVDGSQLFVGEKGVYIDGVCYERDPEKVMYGKTHSIRMSVQRSEYDAMTPDQRKQIPFIGDLAPIQSGLAQNADATPPVAIATSTPGAQSIPAANPVQPANYTRPQHQVSQPTTNYSEETELPF